MARSKDVLRCVALLALSCLSAGCGASPARVTASATTPQCDGHRAAQAANEQGILESPNAAAAKTMESMLEVAACLESYRGRHGGYPSLAVLRDPDSDFFREDAGASMLLRDGWGNELYLLPIRRLLAWPRSPCPEFILASAGADGQFDPSRWSEKGPTARLDEDLVLSSQGWMRWWPTGSPAVLHYCGASRGLWPAARRGSNEGDEHEHHGGE